MPHHAPLTAANAHGLYARLASSAADLRAAQRLRYRVFVQEMGATGPRVDHDAGFEIDEFDAHAAHLILCDPTRARDDQVVGTYRMMTRDMAEAAGSFYCEGEYDLGPLRLAGLNILELGRSCLHPDMRRGPGMQVMWQALAGFVAEKQVDLVFGVASFHGTKVADFAHGLSLLHHRHLAPAALRPKARGKTAFDLAMLPPDQVDRLAAVRQIPPLIKSYLRLGGVVGQGGFVDHAFRTTDVCILLKRDALSRMQEGVLSHATPKS